MFLLAVAEIIADRDTRSDRACEASSGERLPCKELLQLITIPTRSEQRRQHNMDTSANSLNLPRSHKDTIGIPK